MCILKVRTTFIREIFRSKAIYTPALYFGLKINTLNNMCHVNISKDSKYVSNAEDHL